MNLKKVKKRLSTLLAVSMLCSSFNINLSRVQAEESSENVLITEEVIEQVPSEEKTEITIGTEIDQVEESLDSSNEELNSSDEKLSMIEIEGKQDVLTEEVRTVKAKQTIWIVGDSTVSYFTDEYYYPRYGWGTQIDKYFDSERFEVKNIALSGRSSKSFITEPEYQILLDGMNEGDYLFIGFGHNDEKIEAERYTNPNGDYTVTGSFANSLYENYIRPASEKGVTSVLMTPIVRRSASGDWTQSELHVTATSGEFEGGDYPQAVRDLGKDLNVAVVDLTSLTKSLYDELKPSETLNLHAWTSNKEASVDNTHTNIWGAHYNAYFIAKTIKQLNISGLSEYVLESAISSAPTKEEYLKSNPDYVAPSYDNNLEDSILWDDYGIFKGSVFGNVGGEPTTDNFTLETDADGNMHIAVKNDKGKIASAVDGLAMYYYKVPVGCTFTLTATAKVNSFKSNNQVSFGLMARDDMYVDKNIGDALRNVEIRPNITLMVAKGVMASNILSTLSPNETIPITQLNTVSNTCDECTGRLVKYNLYDVINMVNAKGVNLVLNSVELKSNDPSSGDNVENLLQSNSPAQFNVNHLATFKDDKMVGYLDSHEAEFYNVLKNKAKRYVLVTQLEDEYYVAFEAIQTKTKITPNIDDNKFSVKCEVSGEIMENQYPIDLSKPTNMEIVEGYLEEALKVNLTELIKKTQIELKSDIIGVGSQIYFKDTKRWKQLQGYWSDIYPTLSFDVEVNVKLIAVGDIQDLQKP